MSIQLDTAALSKALNSLLAFDDIELKALRELRETGKKSDSLVEAARAEVLQSMRAVGDVVARAVGIDEFQMLTDVAIATDFYFDPTEDRLDYRNRLPFIRTKIELLLDYSDGQVEPQPAFALSGPKTTSEWAIVYGGIHRNTMRNWFKSGKIRAFPIGSGKSKFWRVAIADLPK